MSILTEDMKAVIESQNLGFVATVSPDGKPNVSPKAVRIWDDQHIFLCDMASPNTVRNLRSNPQVEVNVVDMLSRRGYRFFGIAEIHIDTDFYHTVVQRVHREGTPFTIKSVIMIRVTAAKELLSPLYDFVVSEWELRDLYKARRAQSDKQFEEYIAKRGPLRGRAK